MAEHARAEVADRLIAILRRHAEGLDVSESPTGIQVLSKALAPSGGPMWIGAVRSGAAYVSYHLIPVYADPALAGSISPALRKRMQGKSCFNFTRVDEALFVELDRLTARGIARFRELGYLEPGARIQRDGSVVRSA